MTQYFSLSVSQLIGDEQLPKSQVSGSHNSVVLSQVPLISWSDAIKWSKRDVQIKSTISTEFLYSKNAYALQINDDNLTNFAADTVLLIDPELKLEHRDYVVVYKTGQKIPSLKQALFDDGEIYLKSPVQGYKMSALTSKYTLLGVVAEYIKRLRKI